MESKLSIESKKCINLYLLLVRETKSALHNSDSQLHIKICKVEIATLKKGFGNLHLVHIEYTLHPSTSILHCTNYRTFTNLSIKTKNTQLI